MQDDPSPSTTASIEARAAIVGKALIECFRAVIAATPGRPDRPQALAAALDLNRDIASRTLATSRTHDPLAALFGAPGPEPLRKLLRAAAERGVRPTLIAQAEAAVRDFDDLIRLEAGDRRALDAIISARLPDVRERFEQSSRQAIFKGVSYLKGVAADVNLTTAFVLPSADPRMLDAIWVLGLLGVRRLRPDIRVKLASRRMLLEGDVLGAPDNALLASDLALDEFCPNEPARLHATEVNDALVYTLADERVGINAQTDLIAANAHPRILERFRVDKPRAQESLFADIGLPARTLLFDVLLHEDVFPGAEPSLVVHDTAVDGLAHINDPARDYDRVPVSETIEVLGRGLHAAHTPHVPRYPELLARVATHYGLDLREFRGYRVTMAYPMYGAQVHMAFDPPAG